MTNKILKIKQIIRFFHICKKFTYPRDYCGYLKDLETHYDIELNKIGKVI